MTLILILYAFAVLALFYLSVISNTREADQRTLREYLKKCGVKKL